MQWWIIITLSVILNNCQQVITLETSNNCWEVNSRTCIINAKFHNINTYDVHIQCAAGRDSGDRFQKVYHAELNGCLTHKNTNPFALLPRNMNNLKRLTIKEFFIGDLNMYGVSAPYLPKLEELIFKDNVIFSYSSDFFAIESIRLIKNIQFAGFRTRTPDLSELQSLKDIRTLVIREGNLVISYEMIEKLKKLNALEIYSSNISIQSSVVNMLNKTVLNSLATVILEDSRIVNNVADVTDVVQPMRKLSYLKIKNTTASAIAMDEDEYAEDTLDVSQLLNHNPQLTSLIVQRQNITRLIINLNQLADGGKLQMLDVTENLLDDIQWKWDSNVVKRLIEVNKLKLLIDRNPWSCEFFQAIEASEELFEYEKDYNSINVRGLKCRHNSTKGKLAHRQSNRPLDLNNMWLLYGCVLSSLLLIISVTYLVCAMCRSKRREPFYRSLAMCKSPSKRSATDFTMRKLPPQNYETPLQYRTIEFKSEDNCEIYEEIPDHCRGQTLQVII